MADDEQRMLDALKKVAVALKEAGLPFALAGGYAAYACGGPQPTHDVDFYLDPEDLDAARLVLDKAGLRLEDPPEDWLTKVFDGDVMIDLIHRPNDRPVTREMLDRAPHADVDSVWMPVLHPTDLVLGKLEAMTEHYCDFGSVLPVVRALREQVGWDEVRKETEGNAFAEAFLLLVDRLGIVPVV